ncbi:uroplakin-3b-like protein 1 [Rhinoraja longicauda]
MDKYRLQQYEMKDLVGSRGLLNHTVGKTQLTNSFSYNLQRQKNLTKAHWGRRDYAKPRRGEQTVRWSRQVNDSGPRSEMELLPQFVLLCALCGVGYAQQMIPYPPEILDVNAIGKITQTTFALEQPICVFDTFATNCPLCEIWLVVDNTRTSSTFDRNMANLTPSAAMYQNFSTNGFYLTLMTARNDYRCRSNMTLNGLVYIVRVGDEVPCSTSNCNAPLSTGATIRVLYVMLDPLLTTNNVIAVTQWSNDIKLKDASDPNTIDTSTRRSGGMVVITTIISILLFLLLLFFILMLVFVCCDKSASSNFPAPLTSYGSLRKYHAHSLQNPAKHNVRQQI